MSNTLRFTCILLMLMVFDLAQAQFQFVGAFVIETHVDGITDAETTFGHTGPVSAPVKATEFPMLGFVCNKNYGYPLKIVTNTGMALNESSEYEVAYRVDNHVPVYDTWVYENESYFLVVPTSPAEDVYRELASGDSLLIRVFTNDGNMDYQFSLTGFVEAANTVACEPLTE